MNQVTMLELEAGVEEVVASPRDEGRLVSIVIRPERDARRELKTVRLTLEGGLEGDRWQNDDFYRKNGASDPRSQVSLMNSRYLKQLAANDEEAMRLAGDNLIVDLDLSEANLPTGSRLKVGDDVLLEISDLKHTGCSKFKKRYGKEALDFTNSDRGMRLHLRGRYARILVEGTVHVGDTVRPLRDV